MMRNFGSLKQKLKTDDMARHGLMMVAFGILVGVFSFLYQLIMGVMLPEKEFAIVYTLVSIFVIFSIFGQAIEISVTKFVSKHKALGQMGGVNYLWRFSLRRMLLLGVAAFILFTLLTPVISNYLRIDNYLYTFILFSSLLLMFALPTNYGALRGLQRFLPLGSSVTLWSGSRFLLGALLVYLGLGVYGAMLAHPLSLLIAFLVTLFLLKNLGKFGSERVEDSGLRSYAGLTLLAIFAFSALLNMDMLLAKHYLSDEAGIYAATSVLGKIAFYAPMGVAGAMLPKTSALFEIGKEHRPVFLKAMLICLLIVGAVIIVYAMAPHAITDLLGGNYPPAAPYLFKYGLAMGLFSISFLFTNYFLSLNQTKIAFPLLGLMCFEAGLITVFHSSVSQLVDVMLISGALSIALMLPFYFRARRLRATG